MFLSVFFGVFLAIMAAAGTLYWVKEYQDEATAKEVLRQADHQAEQVARLPEITTAVAQTLPEERSADQQTGEPRLVQAVTVKTPDGDLTIPAGKVVHIMNERSAPGTLLVNYEGYSFSIPATSVASSSR